MNDPIQKVIRGCDNRYPTEDELTAITRYADSLPARMEAVRQLQKSETAVGRLCVKEVKKRYPKFERFHDDAMEKTGRDAALLARVVSQAVLLDDVAHLEEKVLYWFRTICRAFGLTPGFVRDVYTAMKTGFEKTLDEASFALVEPYLDRCIEVLSDFPEPAVARV